MKLIHGECKHFKHYSVNYYYIYITTIYIIVNYYSTTHPLILSSANNLLALGNIFYHSQTHTHIHTYIHIFLSPKKICGTPTNLRLKSPLKVWALDSDRTWFKSSPTSWLYDPTSLNFIKLHFQISF